MTKRTIRTNRTQKMQPINADSTPRPAAGIRKISDRELSDVLEPLITQHTERVQAWLVAVKDNLQKSLERALANGPKPVVIDWRSLLSKAAAALNRNAGLRTESGVRESLRGKRKNQSQ